MKKILFLAMLLFGINSSIYADDIHKMIAGCNDGNETMCANLGVYYTDGVGVEKNISKGDFYTNKACELSSGFYCYVMAWTSYEPQGKTKKAKELYAKAYKKFTKSCDDGNGEGCNYLGEMYNLGVGRRENNFKAVDFYTKACENGYADGCNDLAKMYAEGEGVRQNYLQAMKFYTKSCDAENANGCLKLGIIYAKGLGVKQNHLKAKEYFGKSCDLKNEEGCIYYATLNKR